MKNILTIFKRELYAYFTSIIAYIFIIVFLLLSVGIFMATFFSFPSADMRQFFDLLPMFMAVFIPAVSMRLWAEDRKENTWEMLLTFPMKAHELVLGKYLAAMVFFCITLAGTITIPIMLAWLGNPDINSILCGYLGVVLLGAYFMAMGIFFSGLCKDQIVAFVLSLLASFVVIIISFPIFAAALNSVIEGLPLGDVLENYLGVIGHYEDFIRGVLEIGNVVFFLAWIVIFLGLNSLFIESRFRPYARIMFAVTVILAIGIGMAFNRLMIGESLGRFDCTENKIYTVSDASSQILNDLESDVIVNVYITPSNEMPKAYKNLQDDITGKLEELKLASNGRLKYKVIPMRAANVLGKNTQEKDEEEKNVEERLLDKGVKPFSVQAFSGDEMTNKLIYSSIGIAYKDREEEILPQITPNALYELEYNIVNTTYKLSREDMPKIAMIAPTQEIKLDPRMVQLYRRMGKEIPRTKDPYMFLQRFLQYQKYDVMRVKLNQHEPMPEDAETVVIINPRELSRRQLWEINRALVEGKSVFLAVQMYNFQYMINRNVLEVETHKEKPGINKLLEKYGITINEDVLMSEQKRPITVQDPNNPLGSMMGRGLSVNKPIQVNITPENMNKDVSITNRISSLFYLWGSALDVDEEKVKEHELKVTPLIYTSNKSWTVSGINRLKETDFEVPETTQEYLVAAMVEGQFPDVYKGEKKPDWPKPDQRSMMRPPPPDSSPPGPMKKEKGKLILIGCANMYKREMMSEGSVDFFMNSIDALTLDERLVKVRSNKPIDRSIEKPEETTRTIWKLVNVALVPLIVLVIGIVWWMIRRKSREMYRLKQT